MTTDVSQSSFARFQMKHGLPVSTQTIASIAGVSPQSILMWTKVGLIPSAGVGLYDVGDVLQALARPRIDPPSPDDPLWSAVREYAKSDEWKDAERYAVTVSQNSTDPEDRRR